MLKVSVKLKKNGSDLWTVNSVKNALDPDVGDNLTKKEVEDLINRARASHGTMNVEIVK
jgi:hypothetical protein